MGKRIFILLVLIMVLSCFGCASTQRRSSEALPPEATVLPGQVPVESSAESLPEETLQETGKPTEPVQSTEAAEPTQETEASEAMEDTETTEPAAEAQNYILNTNTRKFHVPGCSSAKRIKDSNRREYCGTREEIIQMGYEPCKNCNP